MSVDFYDNAKEIKALLEDALIAGLYDAASIVESQAIQNTRVKTGKTKNAWGYVVDEDSLVATVGNKEENAIWEEYGTGEYALEGNGRKGGWAYQDEKENWHFTMGKKPVRMLFNAFITKKNMVIKAFEEQIKDRFE